MTEIVLETTLCFTSTICLWSAFILAYNWQGVKPRRWLALVLAFWGISWATRAIGLIFFNNAPIYSEVFPPMLIIAGIISSVTFLIWPITIVNPPGIGARKLILFWLPFVLCVAVYYGIIGIFGLPQFILTSLDEFWSHISYFSVWYRLVMCACLLGYLIYTMYCIMHYTRSYNSYVEETYSEYENYTINWIPMYLGGLVAISVTYFANLFMASFITMLLHNVIAGTFFAWLSVKVMRYNSPYHSDLKAVNTIPAPVETTGDDFNSKFNWYKENIEMWLKTEKPYLKPDFSLNEVMKRFGLNRTYASKIFNDGFGKSFLLVVREYRIDYAKSIIKESPSTPMADVAFLCGYSTAQAFHKAFVYSNNGITPGKYAESLSKTQ